MWGEVSNASWPSVFCFSLVKSEPTWPYHEDFKFEQKVTVKTKHIFTEPNGQMDKMSK